MRPESHTFHFNQPLGTADTRFGDKEWKTGEAKTKILLHLRIVSDVAKIDNQILHILQRGTRGIQKFLNVEEKTSGLGDHIAAMHTLTDLVNARSAGNKEQTAGGKFKTRAALESNTILMRGVQEVKRMHIFHLLSLQPFH